MARAGIKPYSGRPDLLPEQDGGVSGFYSVNGQCPVAITLTGPEPVSYDDDYRYGNVCHSDVPTNICRLPAHAPLHEPLPAKELHRQKYRYCAARKIY